MQVMLVCKSRENFNLRDPCTMQYDILDVTTHACFTKDVAAFTKQGLLPGHRMV